MIGRTLSHYRVLDKISRGGMGIVYRALDVNLDREVALKVLPSDLVSDPERRRRFIEEAKAAARLEHRHIGVVLEIDEAKKDAPSRLFGFNLLAATHLYRGHSEDALALIEQGTGAYPESDSNRASSLKNGASLLLEKGQMTRVLELAQRAQKEGKDDTEEWTGLFLAGVAQARPCRWNEAERAADVLRLKAESLPTEIEKTGKTATWTANGWRKRRPNSEQGED